MFSATYHPANIYWFKVNNRRHSGIFIVSFEHISHLFQVFLLLTLNKLMLAGQWVATSCFIGYVGISLFFATQADFRCHARYPTESWCGNMVVQFRFKEIFTRDFSTNENHIKIRIILFI